MTTTNHNWAGLVVTIVIPALILMEFSDSALGPLGTLALALAWPLAWGGYQYYRSGQGDWLAVIGGAGVLLTGGIGLLQLEAKWLAVKEAAVPLVIAMFIIALANTKYSLVETMARQVIDMDRVRTRLTSNAAINGYRQTMKTVTYLVAASFLLSAVLNFVLTSLLVKSPAGTATFNHELARLTLISYPIIVLPSMAVLIGAITYLVNQTKKQTGLVLEDILKGQ